MSFVARALLALVVLSIAGCYRATARSGLAPGEPAKGHDYRWHHGFMLGFIEVSGPYNLDDLCPGGWAELRTEMDSFALLLTTVTAFVYTPQRVTVICALDAEPTPEVLLPALPRTKPR